MQKASLKKYLKVSVSLLALPIGTVSIASQSHAQTVDEVIVTATRRAESVQDIPINITAIGSAQLEQQGLDDLSELVAYIPGINIADQGGRDGNRIVVRGLNADPIEAPFGQPDGGGTVATYIGEIPIFVDLRLNDLQRVEVLIGPQGTLYGAGTLGGAIRYIPNKPNFTENLLEVRADAYSYAEGDGISTDLGLTFNKPITDNFAIRGSLDYLDDKGFIDYPYVVREPGVSEPDPADFANPGDNFSPIEDANTEKVLSGRIAARWEPTDDLDATLTYHFQQGDYGGRNTSSLRTTTIPSGKYEFGSRFEEPAERDTQLLALEVVADLGFAELTSATGLAKEKFNGQRDQTDLLISLDYSYELFPTFAAFTFEDEETEVFNQELRLVSTGDTRYNWIVGAFYNKNEYRAISSEFTPGYVEDFGVDLPASGNLEYFAPGRTELEESAVFGEFGYELTPNWDVKLGARYYEYTLEAGSQTEFPVADYLFFGGDGTFEPFTLGEIDSFIDLAPDNEDDGVLFKINTSYSFDNGNIAYATFSQGYRVGGTNSGEECTGDYLGDVQDLCLYSPGQEIRNGDGALAILNELGYTSDTVDNYEIGTKTTWLDGALQVNGSVYYMDWVDPQIAATSLNAGTSITINAISAATKGLDLDAQYQVSDNVNLRGNFSLVDAELTADLPALIQQVTPPGFDTFAVTGEDGDQLSGSPQTQFSIFADIDFPQSNGNNIFLNGGYAWQDEVLSLVGGRGESFTLPSYGRANIALGYEADNWSLTGYIDNVFDDFSESSVSNTALFNQTIEGANVRRFRTNVLPPRSVGVRMKYNFE